MRIATDTLKIYEDRVEVYCSFSTSWTIQSKQDAFAAFWEWYNDLFGEKK